jgi:Zn-finger nucleic acid-binding protein
MGSTTILNIDCQIRSTIGRILQLLTPINPHQKIMPTTKRLLTTAPNKRTIISAKKSFAGACYGLSRLRKRDDYARAGGRRDRLLYRELLLGNPEQAEKLLNSFKIDTACPEKPRKCPICRKKMQKITVGLSAPPLLLDKCRRGDGLWFDKGELQDILSRAQLDRDSKIQRLLAEIFGQEQNTEKQ